MYALPNMPSSAANFSGPVIFSSTRLENINCILDQTQERGGLYLGDTISIRRPEHLIRCNIQAILSCAPEAIYVPSGDPNVNVVSTKFISANDSLNYDIGINFDEAYDYIQENLSQKQNVLVHCHAGVSRSAAVVIAYVMRSQGLPFQLAFDLVRSRRPRIRPNQNFRAILKEFQHMIVLNEENIEREKERRLSQPVLPPFIPSSERIERHPQEMVYSPQPRTQVYTPVYTPVYTQVYTPKKEDEPTYRQPSGLSITELLMKADMDSYSQKELEQKLNEFNMQLQNETHSLFGREEHPRMTMHSINDMNRGPSVNYQQRQPTRSWQSSSHPLNAERPRLINNNPQRNIVYKPVQSQSVKSIMQKQMNNNKPKTTVVQGGLPESYKSIAGMMAPSSSRYDYTEQQRTGERRH